MEYVSLISVAGLVVVSSSTLSVVALSRGRGTQPAAITNPLALAGALVGVCRGETHEIAKIVVTSYTGSVYDDTISGKAAYNRKSGTLKLHPEKTRGDPIERLQALVCHELAHAYHGPHDATFLKANVYLLNLSAEKLGWTNQIECPACRKYGLCRRDQCPTCAWVCDTVT